MVPKILCRNYVEHSKNYIIGDITIIVMLFILYVDLFTHKVFLCT